MLRALPSSIQHAIYKCIVRAWTDKTIPDQWKWRWLVALQKDTEPIPSLNKLRPIMLLDTIRKVWSNVLLYKIQRIWEKHNFLHNAQHGFRSKRSTDSATIQLLALIESAHLNNTPLYMASFDLKSAFDTLTREAQVMV